MVYFSWYLYLKPLIKEFIGYSGQAERVVLRPLIYLDRYVCTDGNNICHTPLVKCCCNDRIVGVAGVCSYAWKLGTFFIMSHTNFRKNISTRSSGKLVTGISRIFSPHQIADWLYDVNLRYWRARRGEISCEIPVTYIDNWHFTWNFPPVCPPLIRLTLLSQSGLCWGENTGNASY